MLTTGRGVMVALLLRCVHEATLLLFAWRIGFGIGKKGFKAVALVRLTWLQKDSLRYLVCSCNPNYPFCHSLRSRLPLKLFPLRPRPLDLVHVRPFMPALPRMSMRAKPFGLRLRDTWKHAHFQDDFAGVCGRLTFHRTIQTTSPRSVTRRK